MNKQRKLGAVILAAGKGERMKSSTQNKVALKVAGKPIILYGVELVKSLKMNPIIVVVGFAKESIKSILGDQVIYAIQQKRLGTGNAVSAAFKKIPQDLTDVLIINGDDSVFYTKKLINELIWKHYKTNSQVTFLTIEKDNPRGLGRVLRDKDSKVVSVVEEREASELQQKIKEIYPSCSLFKVSFLKKYLGKIKKSKKTGEYYLTSLIDIAIKNKELIADVQAGKISWRSINTEKELLEAEKSLVQASDRIY